jgi:hypothetical protein
LAAKNSFDLPFKHGERFFKIVAMRRRAAARRDVHVDQAIATIRVFARNQNGICVTYDTDVWKALVFVAVRKCEFALEIVRRERRGGLGCY